MKRWEWGFGIRDWGIGNRDRGRGRDRGWNRELIADSRKRIVGNGEWGAVGRQQAAIWLGFAKMNVYNVYKKSCEKMVIIFSQPFFIYFISW